VNPEIREQWTTALRSGDYKQGKTALHIKADADREEPERFCCLGVLCDLAYKAGAVERNDLHGEYAYGARRGLNAAYLPREVIAWAGMPDGRGTRPTGGAALFILNDEGSTFAEIADIIEAEF
jgi:hypothetical protein